MKVLLIHILPVLLVSLLPDQVLKAQVHQSCPLQRDPGLDYENPLFERWLSAYDIHYYDLTLEITNQSTFIEGEAVMMASAERDLDTVVLELQDAMEITEVAFRAGPEGQLFSDVPDFIHREHAIYIPMEVTVLQGEFFFIRVTYRGTAGQGGGFFTGVTSRTDPDYGFGVTYTLSEPMNARDWFPAKQVLEDKIDSVRMNLKCDTTLMAASNGILELIEPSDDQKHIFRWVTRYPMAYYLLSFTVADYRDFSFMAGLSTPGDSVLVQNYLYDSDQLLDDWEEEIRATGPMITSFSRLLIDYPFSEEKYGHAMAPMGGGMEHQTMSTMQDFDFFLVAHELAHQWFGDYVTCGNWQDIWINEGFASYFEYIAAQEILGQEAADGWMGNAMSIALSETAGSVYVPEEEVENTFRLFDFGLSYKKGAILLHMIRFHLNDDDLFFRSLRTYLEERGNGLSTGQEFREVLERVSGTDFSCFFDQWYYGEGFPRFNIQWAMKGDSLNVFSEQTTTAPAVTPFFQTPFELELTYTDGSASRVRLLQEEPEQSFSVPVGEIVTRVRFDPDGWLLKTSTVNKQVPADRVFTFGPNPVTGELVVEFTNLSEIERVKITSMSGQEVLHREKLANPLTMDLSQLADGPYILMLKGTQGTYMERIVKVSGQ